MPEWDIWYRMTELLEIKDWLREIRKSLINLDYIYRKLPDSICRVDCEELLDEVKYLRGYVDCMINFKINVEQCFV